MNGAVQLLAPEPENIPIADLKRDLELSCRAKGVSNTVVGEYAGLIKSGTVFPPVTVFKDAKGVHWLCDGFHRCAAHELAGLAEIAADVREGSRKDALLFAAGANATHGRSRSPADKRRAVFLLLSDSTWGKRSDNWIAQHAAVSHTFVGKLRATCNVSSDLVRESVDGRAIDTSAIGRSAEESDDAIASKLTRKIELAVSAWPESRHDALRDYLRKVCALMAV